MNIILLSLTLRNFKGILSKTIEFSGNTSIYGANESGKSTMYTAFNWLLTGKDEFDRKDFEIKNTNKKELNRQSHEVEAILMVDGREIKLKRVYLERWVKQRGQSSANFEGHTTEFWVNDVPCSLAEYNAKVDGIIESKIIKLVTNPTYFNSLKWEDQRRVLIGIAGDITDADIFRSIATPDNDFGTLILVLNSGKTIDKYKKELSAKKGLLKKAATDYPVRIDEAQRNMPQVLNWTDLETQKAGKVAELEAVDKILSDASQALAARQTGLMTKQRSLHQKQMDLAGIKTRIKTELAAKQNGSAGEISSLKQQIKTIEETIVRLQRADNYKAANIGAYASQIEGKKAMIEQLRADWDSINAEVFQFDESTCACPTCKQILPEQDIEQQREQLRANFNTSNKNRKKR
jgi:exonuclease SbcC